MILIGPVTLFFILLLMFKPIRRVLLWAFVVIAIFLVACWNGWIRPPAHAQGICGDQVKLRRQSDNSERSFEMRWTGGAYRMDADGFCRERSDCRVVEWQSPRGIIYRQPTVGLQVDYPRFLTIVATLRPVDMSPCGVPTS